jgi:hypothetical protein
VTIASFEPEGDVPRTATRAGETAEHLRGAFRVDDLAPGTYVLRLSAEGRIDVDSRAIEVTRGRVIRGEQLVLASAPADTGGEAEGVELSGIAETNDGTESSIAETEGVRDSKHD